MPDLSADDTTALSSISAAQSRAGGLLQVLHRLLAQFGQFLDLVQVQAQPGSPIQQSPQQVAPVDILYLLKNLAIAGGKQVVGEYTNMLQNVMMSGMIQQPKEVLTNTKEGATRSSPEVPAIKGGDPMKFQGGLMAAMTAQLDQ